MSGEEKNRAVVVDHQHHQYGTFQGVANYPPPPPPQHQHHHHQPAIGFPQPVPPPGLHEPSAPPPQYYPQPQGYQTVPGYAVAEGRPVRERRLPCCGIGIGWFLFIIGFFLGAIPWYIGLFILLCARIDYREKPGYIACTIAALGIHINVHNWDSKSGQGSDYESRNLILAILATIAIILGVTKGVHDW